MRLQRSFTIVAIGALIAGLVLAGWTHQTGPPQATTDERILQGGGPSDSHVPPQTAVFHIVGDAALLAHAASEGWPGTGDAEDPVRVEGLQLLTDRDGIHIEGTRLHLLVTQMRIEAGANGIHIVDATNVTLRENTLIGGETGIRVTGGQGIGLTHNRLAGPDTGIRLVGGRGHWVEANVFTGSRVALSVTPGAAGDAVGHRITANEVRDAREDRSDAAGMVLTGRLLRVADNRYERTMHAGVWVQGGHGIDVVGNRFDGGGRHGLLVEHMTGGTVHANRFEPYEGALLSLIGANGTHIRGNHLPTHTGTSVAALRTVSLLVEDNQLAPARHGIVLREDSQSTVRANRFDAVEQPIDLYDAHDTVVSGNRILASGASGVFVRGGSGIVVRANHMTSGETFGTYARDSTTLRLHDNVIEHTDWAIGIFNVTAVLAVHNVLREGNVGIGLHGGDAHLRDNHVSSFTRGIEIAESTDTRIDGGEINHNDIGILALQNASSTAVVQVSLQGNLVGFSAHRTEGPLVADAKVVQNGEGVRLDGTHGARIHSNHIIDNHVGLRLDETTDSQVWDNRFDNAQAPKDRDIRLSGSTDTTWNVSKRQGTNILGGDWLGGNAWHDYNGMDGDLDGLGDTPYLPRACRDVFADPDCVEDIGVIPLDLEPLFDLGIPDRVPTGGDPPHDRRQAETMSGWTSTDDTTRWSREGLPQAHRL